MYATKMAYGGGANRRYSMGFMRARASGGKTCQKIDIFQIETKCGPSARDADCFFGRPLLEAFL
jgi:hypothetical protein